MNKTGVCKGSEKKESFLVSYLRSFAGAALTARSCLGFNVRLNGSNLTIVTDRALLIMNTILNLVLGLMVALVHQESQCVDSLPARYQITNVCKSSFWAFTELGGGPLAEIAGL